MKKLLLSPVVFSCNEHQDTSATYVINEAVSKAEWKGAAPKHYHIGSFDITGTLTLSRSVKINGVTLPFQLQASER